MLKTTLFIATALLVLFSGCKGEDKTAYYVAEYFVRYLEGEQTVKADARIYAGTDAASVKPVACENMHFREYEMKANGKLGNLYQYEAKMPFAAKCAFEFQLTEAKKPQSFSYEMAQVPSFSVSDSLGLPKGLFLTWEGTPLVQGESIVLIFEKEDRSTAEATVTGPTLSNSIAIPRIQLKGISPGTWAVYLVRKHNVVLVEEDHSITAEAAYYTKPMQVTL